MQLPDRALTKAEIIEQVARGTGLTRVETEAALQGFVATIHDSLSRGEPVTIRGFGSFRVQKRAARRARNPATGEYVQVPASHVPVFRPAQELRRAVADSHAA